MVDWSSIGKVMANALVVGATAAFSQFAAQGFSGNVDLKLTALAAGVTGVISFLGEMKVYLDRLKDNDSNMTTSSRVAKKKSYLTIF